MKSLFTEMSNRGKRGVSFIKPDEPNFLKKMKAEIGYKEPDTIEAKVSMKIAEMEIYGRC